LKEAQRKAGLAEQLWGDLHAELEELRAEVARLRAINRTASDSETKRHPTAWLNEVTDCARPCLAAVTRVV
jgi:hypothetical protein